MAESARPRPPAGPSLSSAILRPLLWVILGAWLGALGLFGAVVARAAFRVLPSSELAGAMVGATLGPLQLAGAVAGGLLAVLGALLGRGALAVGRQGTNRPLCTYDSSD